MAPIFTVGDRMRFFAGAATADGVKQHPYLGGQKKEKDGHPKVSACDPPGDRAGIAAYAVGTEV
jgi:hypothetical protein